MSADAARLELCPMELMHIRRQSYPQAAPAAIVDERDISPILLDHARIGRICAGLTAVARSMAPEDRNALAKELERAFELRVRVTDHVLNQLFASTPAIFGDSILAMILRRQIRDALDAKELSELLVLDHDAAGTEMLAGLLIDMEETVRQTLHLEALGLIVLLGDRPSARARRSLERLLARQPRHATAEPRQISG